jgi:hypothetical protein
MATPPVLIKFDSDKDAEKGLDLLLLEGKSYAGVPEGILISEDDANLFRQKAIHFTQLSAKKQNPFITLLAAVRSHGLRAVIRKKHSAA